MMEPKSASEELPALYRAVLDRVAELEAARERDLANRVRAEATHIYSRAWDDRARRELLALLRRSSASRRRAAGDRTRPPPSDAQRRLTTRHRPSR